MFLTLQLPFVDLRRFLPIPQEFVPEHPPIPNPSRSDLEQIAETEYVRCFGHFRLRGYVPAFEPNSNGDSRRPSSQPQNGAPIGEEQWGSLCGFWTDEYLYASTRRGLRFDCLEKRVLLDGKLRRPRAKVRALRFSPFDPSHRYWSPCMRIETGVLYHVPDPLEGQELLRALVEFLRIEFTVPVYEKDGAGPTALVKKPIGRKKQPLIKNRQALAELLVNATTAQRVLKTHAEMVQPGEPLLSVHYSPEEVSSLPSNVVPLSKSLAGTGRIGYHPLKEPRMGVWLFELPPAGMKRASAAKKREIIRNNTIGIMRYWSELQAFLALRRAFLTEAFEFRVRENKLLWEYVNNMTGFLLSNSWHGTRLDMVRNIIESHELVTPDKWLEQSGVIRDFPRQIAAKMRTIQNNPPNVFVSYSHKDKSALPMLQTALADHQETRRISYFDDTYIEPGEEWEQRILNALNTASFAILLVSENFNQSEYIRTIEKAKLIDRYKRGKVRIIPVLLDGSIPKAGALATLQFLNASDPLSSATPEKVNELMSSLADAIR